MIAALLLSLVALYALAGIATWLRLRKLCEEIDDVARWCRASGAPVSGPGRADPRLIPAVVLFWPSMLWIWRT